MAGFSVCNGHWIMHYIAFHPQSDGQSKRTIQTLEDMLRACALEYSGSWDHNLPSVEFAYNNSDHSSIDMASYESLYRRCCRNPMCWNEVGKMKLSKIELIDRTQEIILRIREKLWTAQDRQKSYADIWRRPLEFSVGDRIFLKVSPLKGSVQFG